MRKIKSTLTPLAVYYNVKGDGFQYKVGWLGPDDAFLAIDSNGDGKIKGAKELSFVLWTDAPDDTDLDALAAVFDINLDGKLSSADAKWSKLRVWQDANGDEPANDCAWVVAA